MWRGFGGGGLRETDCGRCSGEDSSVSFEAWAECLLDQSKYRKPNLRKVYIYSIYSLKQGRM